MLDVSDFFQFSDEVSDNADDEDETTDDSETSETALGEYFLFNFLGFNQLNSDGVSQKCI